MSSQALEVAIAGDGNESLALACALSLAGHAVRVWCRTADPPTQFHLSAGAGAPIVACSLPFALVSSDPAAVVKDAAVIFLSAPGDGCRETVALLRSHLQVGQSLVVGSAPLGGSLEMASLLAAAGKAQLSIAETGKLFDSAERDGSTIFCRNPRRKVAVSGITRNDTHRCLGLLSALWTGLVPASNVLERGFLDAESFIAPVFQLFYCLAASPLASADLPRGARAVIAALESEVSAVADHLRLTFPGFDALLREYGGSCGTTLESLMSAVCSDRHAGEADGLARQIALLAGGVTRTLTVFAELALVARVHVPVTDSIISMASAVIGEDLRKRGRSLQHLGLLGLDIDEIAEAVNG